MKFNFKIKKPEIEKKIKKTKKKPKKENKKKIEPLIKTRRQALKEEQRIKKEKEEEPPIIEEVNINKNKKENEENEENEVFSILDNDDKIDFSKIKGDTYLLSKEKVINKIIFKKIPNFKTVINYKYAFDSFWAGKLLDLKDEHILQKYEFQ